MENGKKLVLIIDGQEIDCSVSSSIELSESQSASMTLKTSFKGFDDALEYLGITEFKDRIFNADPNGELYFLAQYVGIANSTSKEGALSFKKWFYEFVEINEKEADINVFFVNILYYLKLALKN